MKNLRYRGGLVISRVQYSRIWLYSNSKETIWTNLMTANLSQRAKSVISPINGPVHRLATYRVPKYLQNLNFLM